MEKKCVWCGRVYVDYYHYDGDGFCSYECAKMYWESYKQKKLAEKSKQMTEIRIQAEGASNKQLRREVARLQGENAQLKAQISYINNRLLQKFSKKKIEKIFAPPKAKTGKDKNRGGVKQWERN